MPEFTIAICTWNRARLLDSTLAAMRKLRAPAGVDWELVVVNNNCTDQTDDIISNHSLVLPIRRLFEPTPGLSSARNLAARNARGEWILWTDDDVLVDAGWMAAYADAIRRWPDADYFGGPIEPWFEKKPPDWILANQRLLQGVLLIHDLGPEERCFSDAESPWGANMAIRSDVFSHNNFDPNLGKTRNCGYVAEEVEFLKSLRSKGSSGVWVPAARVRHFNPKERLTRSNVWKQFHRHGRTVTLLTRTIVEYPRGIPHELRDSMAGPPRWLYRKAIELWISAQRKRLRSTDDWVETYTQAAFFFGSLAEGRRQARECRRAAGL